MELEGGEVHELLRAGGARHHLDGLRALVALWQVDIHIHTSHGTRVRGQLELAQAPPHDLEMELDAGSQVRVAVATHHDVAEERGVGALGGVCGAVEVPVDEGICAANRRGSG
jgi:hypothetical protein